MANEKVPRRQFNVRLDDETDALMTELLPKATAALGIKVSQSDLVRLALRALAREYRAAEKDRKGK